MPEGQDSLLPEDGKQEVYTSLVSSSDLLAGILHLQQRLDPLDGYNHSLGDTHGLSSHQQVLGKGTKWHLSC